MDSVDRLDIYSKLGIDQVIKDIKNGNIKAGKYSKLVKIKDDKKSREELFSAYTKNN